MARWFALAESAERPTFYGFVRLWHKSVNLYAKAQILMKLYCSFFAKIYGFLMQKSGGLPPKRNMCIYIYRYIYISLSLSLGRFLSKLTVFLRKSQTFGQSKRKSTDLAEPRFLRKARESTDSQRICECSLESAFLLRSKPRMPNTPQGKNWYSWWS